MARIKPTWSQGTVVVVPIEPAGFVPALVVRSDFEQRIVVGHFFAPQQTIPNSPDFAGVGLADTAVLTCRFGDMGLRTGRWAVLGPIQLWDPEVWPMPVFARQMPLVPPDRGWLRVEYPDNEPNATPIETPISADEARKYPRDGLSGHIAVEVKLRQALGLLAKPATGE